MSAVGLDLLSRSSQGLSMSSILMIELSARMCPSSWPDNGEIFIFLNTGALMGELSEVVGETTTMLSRERVLLIASERCLLKV